MNEKEIAELRRRFRSDKSNISYIRGCYVNEKKEIISEFNQSLGLMSPEAGEEILAILKKTLAGTVGKHLFDITFTNNQVLDSDEHRLLTALRTASVTDNEIIHTFYQRVIESLSIDGNYLILLAQDSYDVYHKTTDGIKNDSSQVFQYVLCSICPIKLGKPALSYYVPENTFRNVLADSLIGAPALGFLFPAFDNRSTNIYGALYFSRDTSDNHSDFVDAIFHAPLPMPAKAQKDAFQTILQESVADDCSYEVVQAVHEQLSSMIEDHKTNREEEPLVITGDTVKTLLTASGVSEEHAATFSEKFSETFGAEAAIPPANIINPKQFEVKTPDVTIHIKPERSDLVETRILDGVKYLVVRADSSVEVNGVNINIRQQNDD